MAQIDASSFEGTLTLATEQGLSASSKNRVESAPVADFDNGDYILVAQESFNVDSKYNGITRPSTRFIIAKIGDDTFARTIKLSALQATMAVKGKKAPIVGVSQQKDKKDNLTLVWRADKSPSIGAHRAHTTGVLPLSVKDKGGYDVAVLATPVKLTVTGYESGLNLSYKEQENNKGHYDVEYTESNDGKKIAVFNSVRQMQFTTAAATEEEAKAAKKVIDADSQLKEFFNEL